MIIINVEYFFLSFSQLTLITNKWWVADVGLDSSECYVYILKINFGITPINIFVEVLVAAVQLVAFLFIKIYVFFSFPLQSHA